MEESKNIKFFALSPTTILIPEKILAFYRVSELENLIEKCGETYRFLFMRRDRWIPYNKITKMIIEDPSNPQLQEFFNSMFTHMLTTGYTTPVVVTQDGYVVDGVEVLYVLEKLQQTYVSGMLDVLKERVTIPLIVLDLVAEDEPEVFMYVFTSHHVVKSFTSKIEVNLIYAKTLLTLIMSKFNVKLTSSLEIVDILEQAFRKYVIHVVKTIHEKYPQLGEFLQKVVENHLSKIKDVVINASLSLLAEKIVEESGKRSDVGRKRSEDEAQKIVNTLQKYQLIGLTNRRVRSVINSRRTVVPQHLLDTYVFSPILFLYLYNLKLREKGYVTQNDLEEIASLTATIFRKVYEVIKPVKSTTFHSESFLRDLHPFLLMVVEPYINKIPRHVLDIVNTKLQNVKTFSIFDVVNILETVINKLVRLVPIEKAYPIKVFIPKERLELSKYPLDAISYASTKIIEKYWDEVVKLAQIYMEIVRGEGREGEEEEETVKKRSREEEVVEEEAYS